MLPGGVANAACTAGRTVSDEGLDGLALACTRTWAQQAEGLQGTHIRWLDWVHPDPGLDLPPVHHPKWVAKTRQAPVHR